MGVDNDPTHNYAPLRVSLDQGSTYPYTPAVSAGTMRNFAGVIGSIVTAKNGNILIPIYARNGANNYHEVWIGEIVC